VRRVALTFDDGPDPETTPLVLERLDDLGLAATFFLLGTRVLAHPEIVADIASRGHEIAVHGHRHDHHFAHTPAWVIADLDAAVAALARYGHSPRWYRPPYGQATSGTLIASRRRNLPMVLWSAWGREWTASSADEVTRRVGAGLAAGAIVLLHDSDVLSPPGTTEHVLAALAPLAAELHTRELRSATLSELLCA
jgi:peptidoglycan/xylan/chitin deacetylase (PgdA/CDA1 family)